MSSALRKLLRQSPNLDDLRTLSKSLKSDSERSAAVVAAAMLDDILRQVILSKMVKLSKDEEDRLFRGNGPLASFSTKILMAHALGIIGRKTRHDLETMNAIRNLFAHAVLIVGFETKEVKQAFNGLHCLADLIDAKENSLQRQFAAVTQILSIHLINKVHQTEIAQKITSLD